MSNWHAEVTEVVLRRYHSPDAQASFAAGETFSAIVTADISGHSAHLHRMLALPPKLTREDHEQIEGLLRGIGVTECSAKRHGKERTLPTE